MPTYEYACKSCGRHLDVQQSFTDDPLTTCSTCGGPLRKVFGNIAIAFKGSGFYSTDNRSVGKSGPANGASDGSKAESGGKSESGSESKSESKSDAGSGSAKSESGSGSKSESPSGGSSGSDSKSGSGSGSGSGDTKKSAASAT